MSEDNQGHEESLEETKRLFVALKVPGALKKQFAALARKDIKARWQMDDDLHITLRFLGDVPVSQIDDIEQALSRVRKAPFHVHVDGLDAFHKKRQSILYGRVTSSKKLTSLVAEINEKLQDVGFEMPTRPYIPHVTLGRVNNARGLDQYVAKSGRALRAEWEATEFCLMESQPAEARESGQSKYPARKTYVLKK